MKTEIQSSPLQVSDWDAVIVGAGPAGSVAACQLARRGWRVLLVERCAWPREKACGGCLNAAGVELLSNAGLGHVVAGAPSLSRMQICLGRQTLSLEVPAGVVVERKSFDNRLVEAAVAAGCAFLPATHARLLPAQDSAARILILQNHEGTRHVRSAVVLACDGLGRRSGGFLGEEPWAEVTAATNQRLGFSLTLAVEIDNLPADTTAMCVAREGYVGLVRTAYGGTHLGAALLPAECHATRGPIDVIRSILLRSGMSDLLPTTAHPPFNGTGPLTSHREIVGHGRVFALGDAAGYVEPFTGEGVSWAIRAALGATHLLPHDPRQISGNIGSRWNHHFATHLRPRQVWCRSLRLLLASPAMTRAALHTAQLFPRAADLLARKISA